MFYLFVIPLDPFLHAYLQILMIAAFLPVAAIREVLHGMKRAVSLPVLEGNENPVFRSCYFDGGNEERSSGTMKRRSMVLSIRFLI